jgi:hypothetical protein
MTNCTREGDRIGIDLPSGCTDIMYKNRYPVIIPDPLTNRMEQPQ